MPDEPPAADPLPPRLRWFSPWTWTRHWQITMLAGLALVGYPLSIGPALLACRMGLVSVTTVAIAYRPVLRIAYDGPSPIGWSTRQYMRCWGEDRGADVWVIHGFWELERKIRAQGETFSVKAFDPPASMTTK